MIFYYQRGKKQIIKKPFIIRMIFVGVMAVLYAYALQKQGNDEDCD
jgi:hypothetical protein